MSLTSCSKNSYVLIPSKYRAGAPGAFEIPARIDILLGVDDSGSTLSINQQFQRELPQFLDQVQHSGWDYHFAAVPLTTQRGVQQITASRHDSNWGNDWLPAYPGAQAAQPGTIRSDLFTKPSQFTDYVFPLQTPITTYEPGFQMLRDTLLQPQMDTDPGDTGFLRRDALLLLIAISNGDDSSNVSMCMRSDGVMVPCSASQAQASFDGFKQDFIQLKQGQTEKVRFYSLVSGNSSCLGQPAFSATRYIQMAYALGGKAYNLCVANAVSNLMGDLIKELRGERMLLTQRFVFLPEQVNPNSIVVHKYLSDGTRVPLTHSTADGWSFPIDPVTGDELINQNIQDYALYATNPDGSRLYFNLYEGYAIELHGSAQLVGDEQVEIVYLPYGTPTP